MKKTMPILLLALLLLLPSCRREEPGRDFTDKRYEIDGAAFFFPAFLTEDAARSAQNAADLYLFYDTDRVEVRAYHYAPDYMTERFGESISAFDFGTIAIQDLGLNEKYAAATGEYVTLHPEDVPAFRMAEFDYSDSDDGVYYHYYYIAFRETDGDGIWGFAMTCPDVLREGYSDLFRGWVKKAELPVTLPAE